MMIWMKSLDEICIKVSNKHKYREKREIFPKKKFEIKVNNNKSKQREKDIFLKINCIDCHGGKSS